jgi:hypothetical protein
VPPSCAISGGRSIGSTLLPDPGRRAATYVFQDRPCQAGSGEAPGWTLLFAAARLGLERGSFMGCVLAGCRGEAWLKKGLLSSK